MHGMSLQNFLSCKTRSTCWILAHRILDLCWILAQHRLANLLSGPTYVTSGNIGYQMWRRCSGSGVLFVMFCKILCRVVQGLSTNLSVLTVAESQYDILLCYETWSMIYVAYRNCWFRIPSPCFDMHGKDAAGPRVGSFFERRPWGILRAQVSVWLLRNASICGLRESFSETPS